MMQRTLLLVLLIGLSFLSFGQDSTLSSTVSEEPATPRSEYYPALGDFGVTANVTGLINAINLRPNADLLGSSSLILRYTQSDRLTYRFGIAPQINRYNLLTTDSIGKDLVELDSTANQSTVSFRPGVEFHLKGTNRLDPYVSLDAEFGVVGKQNINSVTNITDTTGTTRIIRTITQDGGLAFGARLGLGMNYYVSKKLFFGVEYGARFSNIISGGDRQEVLQIEPVSGANTTVRELSSARSNNLNFAVDPMVSITFGYFFGF